MYYPILLDITGKRVTVFGGGKVAYKRSCQALECGADVTVVSDTFVSSFYSLKGSGAKKLVLLEESYREDLIGNPVLVIAATDSKEVNIEIYRKCRERGILCNVADDGKISDFILPAVVRRGDFLLTVSTSGKSPSFSKKVKGELEKKYDRDVEEYVRLLGIMRQKILEEVKDRGERKRALNHLVELSMEELRREATVVTKGDSK